MPGQPTRVTGGPIRQALLDVYADDSLTPTQKRRRALRIRGVAHRDALPSFPVSFTHGQLTVGIQRGWYDATNDVVNLFGVSVTHATIGRLPLDPHQQIANPPTNRTDPTQVIDGEETRILVEDVPAALREAIISIVREQVGR